MLFSRQNRLNRMPVRAHSSTTKCFHLKRYLNIDQKEINEPRDWISVQTSIRAKAADPQSLPVVKRLLTQIIPFPRSLANLVGRFTSSLHPHEADDTVLWGLADLNITVSHCYQRSYLNNGWFLSKLSISSPEKLNRTVSLVKRLRNVIELFNRCLSVCEDMNEPRYAMIEVLGTAANSNLVSKANKLYRVPTSNSSRLSSIFTQVSDG